MSPKKRNLVPKRIGISASIKKQLRRYNHEKTDRCAAGFILHAHRAAAVAETLNVAYMPNYGSLWAVETAINKGYFEEEGLTLNLVEFADGPTIIRGYGKRLHRCGLHRPGRA